MSIVSAKAQVTTPVAKRHFINNGAVYVNGNKVASAVLAHPVGTEGLAILVTSLDGDHHAYVSLDQVNLPSAVIQFAARVSGEHYYFGGGNSERTDVDHVWRDSEMNLFYFSDETENFVGPYHTKQQAKDGLDHYVKHVLG